MPILFSAVAQETTVVSKFASCDGNFTEIVNQVLLNIPAKNDKMTYSHGHYLFHYVKKDHNFYFCVTDKLCQRSRAFLFLNEIGRRFEGADKSGFSKVLAEEMYRYNEDYSTITIRHGELDELNRIGVGCSESILGEKILLINNTDNLTYSTITYVGKDPEKIIVTFRKSTSSVYASRAALATLVLGITIYIFGPTSGIILLALFWISLYLSYLRR